MVHLLTLNPAATLSTSTPILLDILFCRSLSETARKTRNKNCHCSEKWRHQRRRRIETLDTYSGSLPFLWHQFPVDLGPPWTEHDGLRFWKEHTSGVTWCFQKQTQQFHRKDHLPFGGKITQSLFLFYAMYETELNYTEGWPKLCHSITCAYLSLCHDFKGRFSFHK